MARLSVNTFFSGQALSLAADDKTQGHFKSET